MIQIFSYKGFKVEFNGKATYFVSNSVDCIGHFSTERKAMNFVRKAIENANV